MCPDGATAAAVDCLLRQVRFAVEAGVDVVQIRERDLPSAELFALVAESVAIAQGTPVRVVVNDRLDVALACGAHGVHLRGDSAPAEAVRRHVPSGFLIGRSVHAAEEASVVASSVDYLVAGTVWPTPSKDWAAPLLGPDGLRHIVHGVRIPVLAVGGVDLERCAAVAATGAAGVAAIGLFAPVPGLPQPCGAIPLQGIVTAVRARFDAAG